MDLSYADKELFRKMFGVYVRESREAKGLSPAELAKLVEIPRKKLEQIEKGSSGCQERTFCAIENQLGLQEDRMERMLQVARIRYVGDFMELLWDQEKTVEL